MTVGNSMPSAGTAAQARSFWPAPAAPRAAGAREDTHESEGPGEDTQALALILSALGNLGEITSDDSGGNGQGEADEGPALSGQDVLRLLEVQTKTAIADEADAWTRALPPHDVVFTAPTHHEVYRARAAHLIQTDVAPRPPAQPSTRQRDLPQDDLLRGQIIRARFSMDENRARYDRRIA